MPALWSYENMAPKNPMSRRTVASFSMMPANHPWKHQQGKEYIPWSGLSEDLSSASRVLARKPRANIRTLESVPTSWAGTHTFCPGNEIAAAPFIPIVHLVVVGMRRSHPWLHGGGPIPHHYAAGTGALDFYRHEISMRVPCPSGFLSSPLAAFFAISSCAGSSSESTYSSAHCLN